MKPPRRHCPVCSEREGATDSAYHNGALAAIFAAAFIFTLLAAVLLVVLILAEFTRTLAG